VAVRSDSETGKGSLALEGIVGFRFDLDFDFDLVFVLPLGLPWKRWKELKREMYLGADVERTSICAL